ncbi:MAG TPA: hypothetical protein VK472_05815, partial [Allosphingosinicella sp.]|nr:hypothetical protein [Allosphingosinicella sp.]
MSRENKERAASAAGVAIFHALLGYAFFISLGFDFPAAVDEGLKIFNVVEPPPPPLSKPARPDREKKARRARPRDPEGSASPA